MIKKIKVSIVDDHPLYRKGLKSMLEECPNFEFLTEAGTGKEFVESLSRNIPDVVLLDYQMPEMDGVETTVYLKRYFPEIKILILTMYNDLELAKSLSSKGVNGFLVKETDVDLLTEAINSVVENGFYFNEFISPQTLEDLKSRNALCSKQDPSEREQQVICLLCLEYSNKEIAEILSLSVRTIETYRDRAIEKLGVTGTAGLIHYGVTNKLDVKFTYQRRRKEN
jgi:DNA-binding NarL/FixJ family response regulator